MLFWAAVEQEPHQKPSCAEESRKEEGPPPPKMGSHPRNGEWSDNGANIRAGIEDTGCQRSLLFGKPLGDSLYRGREVSGFSEPQQATSERESDDGVGKRMSHCRQTPDGNRHGIANSRSYSV